MATRTQVGQGALGAEPLAGGFGTDPTRPSLVVEMGFGYPPSSEPVWTDVTAYVRAVSIRRGRSDELTRMDTGTCSVTFNNLDARFDPSNASGPYFTNLKPIVQIRVRGVWRSDVYPLFYGYVETFKQSYRKGPAAHLGDAVTTVTAADAFKVLNLAAITTTIAQDKTVAQITEALDAATGSFPAALRDLPAAGFGSYTLKASTLTNQATLEFLYSVADAEGGVLYVSADGKVTFKLQNYTGASFDAASRTWGDAAGEWPYTDLESDYSDAFVYNDIRITRSGGAEQSSTDGTSLAAYGKRTLVRSGTLHLADASALDLSLILVARYKDPFVRVTRLHLAPTGDAWPQVLSTDLTSKLVVKRRPPPSGTVQSHESVVQGIDHNIAPGRWTTSFSLSQFAVV